MELFHDPFPDLRALYFPLTPILAMELDTVDDLLDHGDADRSLLAGLLQAVEDLDTVEGFSSPVLLDHEGEVILWTLTGGESFLAAEAFSSSANHVFLFAETGIDNLCFGMIAERAFHGRSRTVVGETLKADFMPFFSASYLPPWTFVLSFGQTYPRSFLIL
jgi:hypothetical protein